MQDADALDLLHRLDAFAHDALDAVEQLAAEQRSTRAGSVSTFSASLRSRCASASTAARTRSASAAIRISSASFSAISTSTVRRRRGDLALAHGLDAFLGFGRARAGDLGLGLRGRLFERLLIDRDRLFHQRGLDDPSRGRFRACAIALAHDARFVDAAVGGDARALDLFAGGDLGLLQAPAARATSNCSIARRRSSRAASSACSRSTSVVLDLLAWP